MTALVLLFGLGVFLVYDGWTAPPRTPDARERREGRVTRLLREAGYPEISARQLVVASVAAGAGGAAVVLIALGSPSMSLLAGAAASTVPFGLVRARRRKRRRALRQSWPEAVELLAGAVRAGDTLPTALALVSEKGPETLRPVFGSVVADQRVSGDLAGALSRAMGVLVDPTADRVLLTLSVSHRVGGRELGRVLRTLAAFLREDLAVRKEIESRQSWTVVAARVAAAAPWLVLVLVGSRPQGRRAFDSLSGLVVLIGGAVATIIGYRMMLALGRLPEEPRVLGGTP